MPRARLVIIPQQIAGAGAEIDYDASGPAITGLSGGSDYSDGSAYIVGFEFTIAAAILVTHLGIYDAGGNGLGTPAAPVGPLQVGIFDNDDVLLEWATIGFYTGPEAGVLDGSFRYRPIRALRLEPGTYKCAAILAPYIRANAADFNFGGSPTFAAGITLVDHYYDTGEFLNTQLPADPTPQVQLMSPMLDVTTNLGGQATVGANFKFQNA